MQPILRTALLAYGMSGKVFHAPFIEMLEGFQLYAVLERNQQKAHLDYPAIKSYQSFEELIADEQIDLVIINTPNYTHFEYACEALKAGKHILVEKPFTATVEEAKIVFELARQVGKKAMVYQNRRCDSGFKATKKVLESGVLGQLIEVHFRYDRYRNEISPKFFKEEPLPASGLSYDLGPHLLDQAICLFGKPQKVHKVLRRHRAQTQVDDYFMIQLGYPSGLEVFLTASMLVPDIREAFVIHGMQGSFLKNHADVQEAQLQQGMKPTDASYGIELPEDQGTVCLVKSATEREISRVPSEKGDYAMLFHWVYQHIVEEKPYPITEEDILLQLEILELPSA